MNTFFKATVYYWNENNIGDHYVSDTEMTIFYISVDHYNFYFQGDKSKLSHDP